jgi:hypothetical protein
MTTLSASRTRAYTNTNINGLLVPATTTIYAGAAVGVNEATGSPRPLQAGDKFIGFAQSSVNHIRGQEREAPLTVVDSGQVALQISGAVATDIGKDVFATDDDTFTFSSSGGSLVGVAKQLLSAGRMMVEILPPSALNGVRLAPGGTALVSGDGTVIPLSYLLGKQHTAQSKSDLDALESAALYTLDIPANTLGPNSILRVRSLWTVPSSGATKRLRGRFGGTVLWNLDLTTHVSYPLEFILSNRNSRASQIAQANNLSWAAALGSSAVQTFTVDFATAQQLTITAQWPVAGAGSNNITLESVFVEHLYGA